MCRGLRRQGSGSLNTIIHGELWEKNLLLSADKDKCVLLDWKSAKLAAAALDLAFFLFSSASLEVLDDNLAAVFDAYADEFAVTLRGRRLGNWAARRNKTNHYSA